MNVLPDAKRELIVRCLCEGMSIRATARVVDVAKGTVLKLLVDAGRAAAAFQDRVLRDLPCRRFQVDEIWAFCHAKAKNVPGAKRPPPEAGDLWTWVAMCVDTKLVPSWRVGDRGGGTAEAFMLDLASRVRHRIQLVSDAHAPYVEAVDAAFGRDVDYAMLVKQFHAADGTVSQHKIHVMGRVPPDEVSTSLIERQNLQLRMSLRRFTRRTNAHSKKTANHRHALALWYLYYNFCRIHETVRVPPAMEAGVVNTMWDVPDILRIMDHHRPSRPN